MYNIVIPKDKQFRLTYQNSNRDEIIRFREELKKLHFNVTGKNYMMSGNVKKSLIDNMLHEMKSGFDRQLQNAVIKLDPK
jgi:hypothetical protein